MWARSREDWQRWQEYRPVRNEFNRPLIFSLMRFHHETDIWLFGGVFKVLARPTGRYEVELTDLGKKFIGRLKLRLPYKGLGARVKMENYYPGFIVQEILREPYSGRSFCGYDEIDLSFEELEVLIKNDRPDWKTALGNVKGVYLITDINTGKRYVGSAYGDQGIWSRWSCYISTGHGGNKGMYDLINHAGLDYCRAYFRFSLLEQRLSNATDAKILERESYWKRILLSRGEQGLNRN
ncbi:GIY-YIG nuclease family protein [Bartonella sp. DGB1]|uniref:GIY-YIG nuclease family protein n=1 Tax=Bartonella sp. DGB1 TaxID=3239807 RepID=UPI003524EF06